MASANEAELLRMFTRVPPEMIAQDNVPTDEGFDVVIQAEVGSALFNTGVMYKILVVVRDLTDSTTIATFNHRGNFNDASWITPFLSYPFHLNPQGAAKQDHVYQAIGVMVVGKFNPIVEIKESDLFIIT